MSRNFPSTSRQQGVWDELIYKEMNARLGFANAKAGEKKSQPPPIPVIPKEFRIKPRREEDIIASGVRTDLAQLPEMRAPEANTQKLLYDGISHDGEGRAQYLKKRKDLAPEDKFVYPYSANWEYGWKLGEVIKVADIKKPAAGRTRIIDDTFYRNNGIPERHVLPNDRYKTNA